MRRIIRRREIVTDDWRYAGESSSEPVVATGPVVRLLAALLEDAKAGKPLQPGSGVRLGATDEPALLVPFLDRLALIVIEFSKLGDGRGFTQGRLLRERYRYRGELRAAGVLKRDQLFFLARCGFDAFDLDPAENLEEALIAFNSFSVAYQAGSQDLVAVRAR
ncbi:MAG: DUF934 domain-containing protein [Steroidobacterales bacterium]